jgi:DNA polymerase-3 subunit alpha
MNTDNFTHLHLHTCYSLGSGTIKIDDLIKIALKNDIKSLALTDYLNIFGAIKFYNKCIASNIKPIIGCEIPVFSSDSKKLGNIVLLCQNINGYHNLNKILSYIHTSRSSYLGADPDILKKYNSDLICLSGGRNGLCGINILNNPLTTIEDTLSSISKIYQNKFYVEIDRTSRANENSYINELLYFASKLELALVATNDVLFVSESDFEANEVKVAINTKTKLDDRVNQTDYSFNQYFKTIKEMKSLFSDIPSAISNVSEIVKMCNFKLPIFKYHLPKFSNPTSKDDVTYFKDLCENGLKDYLSKLSLDEDKYQNRLDIEIDVIQKMGFASYFLIVQEFIQWAKNNDVPVGPGRGSGAGSLVAFVLGITTIDPIKYNLLFERFLNPERISMPDFDIDFCMNKRQKVIDHIISTYGQDKVSQIITYSTLSARAVIRDVGRVLDFPYGFVDYIAKLVPFSLGIKINEALKASKELAKEYKTKDDVKTIIDFAQKIEGLPRGVGTHAAGIVISPSNITNFMPIYSLEDKNELITQFDKDDIESIGLVKFDILGLTTLTIMDQSVKLIKVNDKSFNLNDIPLDDSNVFKLLQDKMTTGIFQLESLGMKKYMAQLKPDKFEDIVALVALYRPGPLGTNMVDDFISNKHGAEIKYEHPLLKNILSETNGLILYQEQVMEIARSLGNYSLGDADLLRRAMGKKKLKEMEDHRSRFILGCKENNISINISKSIFDKMEKFAGYGFNKSHSVAYAMLSYQTAYLKCYYPTEFYSAALSSDMDNTNKIINLLTACKQSNIDIKLPDINNSNYKFSPLKDKVINYGLGAIKGVGENAAKHIWDIKKNGGNYKSIDDFCSRVNLSYVNSGTIESLISSGCFDSISDKTRSENLSDIQTLISQGHKRQLDLAAGQNELFDSASSNNNLQTKSKEQFVRLLPSNLELIKERKVLGYYLSSHPIKIYEKEILDMNLKNISNIHSLIINSSSSKFTSIIAGIIIDSRSQKISKNKFITIYKVDDSTHQINISFFEEKYLQYKNLLKEDELLFFSGEIFIDDYDSQLSMRAERVYTLTEAREKYSKYLSIVFPSELLSKEKVIQIKSIFEKYNSGKTQIKLFYKTRDIIAPISLSKDIRVLITDKLLSDIKLLTGNDSVTIKYH